MFFSFSWEWTPFFFSRQPNKNLIKKKYTNENLQDLLFFVHQNKAESCSDSLSSVLLIVAYLTGIQTKGLWSLVIKRIAQSGQGLPRLMEANASRSIHNIVQIEFDLDRPEGGVRCLAICGRLQSKSYWLAWGGLRGGIVCPETIMKAGGWDWRGLGWWQAGRQGCCSSSLSCPVRVIMPTPLSLPSRGFSHHLPATTATFI